jgi:hypothetical protein
MSFTHDVIRCRWPWLVGRFYVCCDTINQGRKILLDRRECNQQVIKLMQSGQQSETGQLDDWQARMTEAHNVVSHPCHRDSARWAVMDRLFIW